MSNKYDKMLQRAFELDKRDGNKLIAQWEALGDLFNHQVNLDENEQKIYQRMCEKVKYWKLLEGDELVLLKCWKNRLKEIQT